MKRMFAVSADGDRMCDHVTDAVTTREDGKVCAPFVIKKGQGGDTAAAASKKRVAGEQVVRPSVRPIDRQHLVDEHAVETRVTLSVHCLFSMSGCALYISR
jgi:hypothetical protein